VRAPEPLQLLVLDLGHALVSLHVARQRRRELEFCVALVARPAAPLLGLRRFRGRAARSDLVAP
jgi:hypothetical protein